MKTTILGMFMLASTIVMAQMNKTDATTGATMPNNDAACKENNIWNVIQNRRSVRKFKPDSVPEKDIIRIIDAARMAPTSGNQQPWKFLVIKDRNKINQIKDSCIKRALDRFDKNGNKKEARDQYKQEITIVFEDYCSAPVYIVVLTDNNSTYPSYNHWDGPLGAGYLMLAARSLGYGTVFITDAISEKVTKDVLKIPDNYTRVCITPLGIPYEWPKIPPKKNLEEFIIREGFNK